MKLSTSIDSFALAQVFTISRGSRTSAEVLSVSLEHDGVVGRGECVPYARYNETLDSVRAQIEAVQSDIENGMTRQALQTALPSGAARNAVDCAMWDLQAKRDKQPVWQLAGLEQPGQITTAYTLSLEAPEKMLAAAKDHAARPLLKIKLGGQGDIERLKAVREGAPNCRLIVDANEGWTLDEYQKLAPVMLELGVVMVEQPLPAGDDDALLGADRPLPICADESCHDRSTLASLQGKYDFINIKLDKTGGLTEALALRQQALDSGFRVMVGCMVSSSLSMAPALLVAQNAEIIDLDGPLLLAEDREPPITVEGSLMSPASSALWG